MTQDKQNAPPEPGRMLAFSPWLIVLVAAFLGLAVLALSLREREREERKMSANLVDRANALIWALEAGTRTWLGYDGDRNILQQLVEETAKQPGLVYLAVTDADGAVLCHSDAERIGQKMDLAGMEPVDKLGRPAWRTVDGPGTPVFEVYRRFAPVADAADSDSHQGGHHRGRGRMGMGRGMGRMGGGAIRSMAASGQTVVMVGLDQKPFQEAMRADLYNSVVTAGLVAGLGLAGLVSVFWAERFRRSRRLLMDSHGEVRRLQSEVQRNERLTALGTLAAGVAHEIRNPLSTIKGLAAYMAGRMPEGERERNAGKAMIQEINRLNNVVSELLEFSRPDAAEGVSTDVNEVVARALRLADADVKGKDIAVRFVPDPALPPVRLNAERFTQALLNLFLNAVQAMSPGGTLRVAANADPRGGVVAVTVADDGAGMTADVRESIFNPYFTTKPSGTGIGLAIVQQVVTAHGGSVGVESEPGKGSVFTVLLPALK